MRDGYDFSHAEKNPYVKGEKIPITIRLDSKVVNYFKLLSKEVNMPYQTIINAYLTDCAIKERKLTLHWD
ncbi:MAG: BrnA antitoxin family protein [Desulfovibrio sp.]|nr:BrnA antitoxin family protein [Desulfovibrio sp.]